MKKSIALMALLGVAVFAQQKGSFTDPRDKKTYQTVKIGTQTWMAENLNYAEKDSKCADNKPANCSKYGRLYDWEMAKKACPSGWHLPSNDDWDKLFKYVDAQNSGEGEGTPYRSETAGKHLKAKSGWTNGGNGTDKYGFSALPGGGRNDALRTLMPVGNGGNWWSASEYESNSTNAYYWHMYFAYDRYTDIDPEGVYWLDDNKSSLSSVRCLRD